jgi:SAM-dependent methyltransferase
MVRVGKKIRTKKGFDDKSYWKKRHTQVSSLRASGLQSVGLRANHYIYKIVAEQYLVLLNSIDTDSVDSILDCGYGDGYFLDFFKDNFPTKKLYGIDISEVSNKKIKPEHDRKKMFVGDLTDFDLRRKFDLVHCFDVLYHILGEADYRSALSNIADHSERYVILHERFFNRVPLITFSHIRFRRSEVTNQILNAKGFFLYSEIPSHFFGVRLFSSFIYKISPSLLYKIDKMIINKFPNHIQELLSSHTIRVYKKAK